MTAIADFADLAARVLCAALFLEMIAVVGFEVVMRYVFAAPTFWSSELARWSMVWVAFLGFALAFRRLDHIRVDFHLTGLTGLRAALLAVARYVVVAVLAIVLLLQGGRLTLAGVHQTSVGLGVSYAWLYGSTVVSAVLILIFLTELALRREIRPF